MFTIVQSANLVCHNSSLLLIAIGYIKRNLVALRILAKYGLFYLSAIVVNKTIGCSYNILRATIILLKLKKS